MERFAFSESTETIDDNNQVSSGDETGSFCSNEEPELQDSEEDVFSASGSDEDNTENSYTVDGRKWKYIARRHNRHRQYVPQNGTLIEKSQSVETIKQSFHLFVVQEIMDNIIKYTNQKADAFYSGEANNKWRPIGQCELNAINWRHFVK